MHDSAENVRNLCMRHGHFSEEQIQKIIDVAKVLPYFSQARDADVFIDILAEKSSTAIVVAEHYRERPLYEHSFIEVEIYRVNEPAVFRSFDLGVATEGMNGISYDAVTGKRFLIRQSTLPILHEKKAIAVLVFERALYYSPEPRPDVCRTSADDEMDEILLYLAGFRQRDGAQRKTKDGILMFDEWGALIYYNRAAADIYRQLGYHSIDELSFMDLNPTTLQFEQLKELSRSAQTYEGGSIYEDTVTIDDHSYIFRYDVIPPDRLRVVLTIEDVTELYRRRKEENQYLVSYREIHHRNKNNLQTIASLLKLQGMSCGDERVQEILDDSIKRIQSIATTHELLAQKSSDYGSINSLLKRLAEKSVDYMNLPERKIDIIVQGDDFPADSTRGTVICLICNELIQNSVKHAFPDGRKGTITIEISNGGDFKVIEVRDDGIGFDTGNTEASGLGTMIVRPYVEESLNGKLFVSSNERGTSTSFAFTL